MSEFELPALPAPELPPDVGAATSSPELHCPDCDFEAKPGVMARAQLANHRRKHKTNGAPAAKAQGARKAPAKERAPRVAAPPAPRSGRRSAAKFLTPLWTAVAAATPGRAGALMMWEAPAAGPILDKLAAGSIFDRLLLQRMAKEEDRWGDLLSLLTLPAIGMTVDSGTFHQLPPVLQNAIAGIAEDSIVRMLGQVLEDQERRAKEIDRLEKKARDAGIPDGLRAEVERLLAVLFAPPPQPAAPQQAPQYGPVSA